MDILDEILQEAENVRRGLVVETTMKPFPVIPTIPSPRGVQDNMDLLLQVPDPGVPTSSSDSRTLPADENVVVSVAVTNPYRCSIPMSQPHGLSESQPQKCVTESATSSKPVALEGTCHLQSPAIDHRDASSERRDLNANVAVPVAYEDCLTQGSAILENDMSCHPSSESVDSRSGTSEAFPADDMAKRRKMELLPVMPPTAKSILERRERAIREGRRHEAKLSDAERRILRRLRNRESAERCRLRRLEQANQLENKISSLQCENDELRKQAADYEHRIKELQAIIATSVGSKPPF